MNHSLEWDLAYISLVFCFNVRLEIRRPFVSISRSDEREDSKLTNVLIIFYCYSTRTTRFFRNTMRKKNEKKKTINESMPLLSCVWWNKKLMKENLLPIFLGLLFGEMIGYHENHNTVSERAQLHAAYVQIYYIQSFYASLINFAVIHTQILSSACGKAKLAIELLSCSLCMLQHRLYIQPENPVAMSWTRQLKLNFVALVFMYSWISSEKIN